MDTLADALAVHARRYPLMQPCDAVKIVFQNEFGGGHFAADPVSARAALIREYAAAAPSDTELTEPLGNGLVRVDLAAAKARALSPEALADAFLRSAREQAGSLASFTKKLTLLRESTALFRFSRNELDTWLAAYAADGYPPVSHSDVYRQAYRPSYRVILEKYV